MTNLAYNENYDKNRIKTIGIPDEFWNYITKELKIIFRLSRKELKWLKNCKTAKLIATIPFVAECYEPERTAIAHLCIYLAEIRGFQKYCSHLPSDDINLFNRLAFISTFEGGNNIVINYGMNLLALEMIEGYNKSKEKDKINNIYNPFISGSWDYEKIKSEIINKLKNSEYSGLEEWFNSPAESWNA